MPAARERCWHVDHNTPRGGNFVSTGDQLVQKMTERVEYGGRTVFETHIT